MNNEIINAVNVLKFEGTILYPTDTIWGIGCDALSDVAVEKIFKIKKSSFSDCGTRRTVSKWFNWLFNKKES